MLVLMKELKRVLLLDPSIATFKVGDKIISQSVREHLKPILDFSFIVEASTHLPVTMYLKNIFYSYDFDYRFVCGSNLIRGKMNSIMKLWDVNLRSASIISPLILIGVGWWKKGDTPNAYSRALYSKLLDKKSKVCIGKEPEKLNMGVWAGFLLNWTSKKAPDSRKVRKSSRS
jgi:hypothetical protein